MRPARSQSSRRAIPDEGIAAAPDVPNAAKRTQPAWHRLSAPTRDPARFDVTMVADLPTPARRWLTRAIAPGTPLWRSARLQMHGQIRLGRWRSFAATQVLKPPEGYIWAASTRILGLPVAGYDLLCKGAAQMRWRLLGAVPVMSAEGNDVTRSTNGRLAAECVLLPTAFTMATWTQSEDVDTALATWTIGGEQERVEVHVGPDGRLLDVRTERWGNPGGAPYGRYPFGVTVERERAFAGITIPSTFRAGWWWGTERQDDGEFFRAEITAVTFR